MALCHYCGKNNYAEGLISCAECQVTFDDAMGGLKGPWANGVSTPLKEKAKGFLSNKEIWNSENLNPIQSWWATTLDKAIGVKFINDLSQPLEPVGVFNVESGIATLTTNPEFCENCSSDSFFVSEVCENCGNGPLQRVVMAAGSGDGIYGVWQDPGEPAGSILVSFVRTTGDAPSESDAREAIKEASPLYLGSLASKGAIYIRDSMKGQLSVIANKGEYDVVAWIGSVVGMPSMEQMFENGRNMSPEMFSETLSPVAVTLTLVKEGNFAQDALQTLKASDLKASQVAAALWGDVNRTVQSHMQSADRDIAFLSGQFLEGEVENRQIERKFGNFLFHALTGGRSDFGSGMDKFLNGDDAETSFSAACMLMTAGHQPQAIEMMKTAAGLDHKLAQLFYQRMKRKIDACEDLFPIWGVSESDYMTYLAIKLADVNPEDSLDLWLMAADRGSSNAVSYYTWNCLQKGAFQETIDMYDATREFCLGKFERMLEALKKGDESMVDQLVIQAEQLTNSTINYAVAHIAAGSDEEMFIEGLTNEENSEATAYKALYFHRNNRIDEAASLVQLIDDAEKVKLIALCEREISTPDVDEWFKNWFKDLAQLLNR
jgi:hypothetical protein